MREHTLRHVSYTAFANYCEKCDSLLSKIFDKGDVTIFCANLENCEKVEKKNASTDR